VYLQHRWFSLGFSFRQQMVSVPAGVTTDGARAGVDVRLAHPVTRCFERTLQASMEALSPLRTVPTHTFSFQHYILGSSCLYMAFRSPSQLLSVPWAY
jgi:hypothetical protein